MINKTTIQEIKNFKNKKNSLVALTAYDCVSAQVCDDAEIPIVLVGDSASMVVFGYDTTIPVSMEEMLLVVKAVSRSNKTSLIVADLPFLSYQTSIEKTILNAGLLIKNGGAGAVKLEGGQNMASQIESLVGVGIPVMGHVGLTPQSFHQLSGYKIQGKTPDDAKKIIDDAKAVEDSGAFSVVLECIPESLAEEITSLLNIPTIGIGSGLKCDGQIQVYHDIMGLSKERPPKHAMQKDNLYAKMLDAAKNYKKDIQKS